MQRVVNNIGILSDIKWYFELKNLSLKNALSMRCPLSVENQRDLRQYYSQYFAGLLSATEMLLEKEYPYQRKFRLSLESCFAFDGFPDGEQNYCYIRELRNSIIHRGFDISSAAHINDDFPLFVAPPSVKNRSGAIEYRAFGYYLLEIIKRCESVVGKLFSEHLKEVGFLEPIVEQEQLVAQSKQYIVESSAMTGWVRQQALEAIGEIDHVEVQKSAIRSVVEVLSHNVIITHDI